MDTLSPINYTITVCKATPWQAILSACTTVLLFLFGDDQTAITIALVMLTLDTITGVTYAIQSKNYASRQFWRVIPKGIAIISAFIVGNLLAIFQPHIGTVIEYGIAAAIIIAEGTSILENVVKISPDVRFQKILSKIKKL